MLKSSSKPVPQQRKRRKVEILGTFDQYKVQREEHKHSESASEQPGSRRQSIHEVFGDKSKGKTKMNTGGPNIIGNVEDVQAPHTDPALSYPSLNNLNKDEQMSVEAAANDFKDITGSLVRTRRTNSKSRK